MAASLAAVATAAASAPFQRGMTFGLFARAEPGYAERSLSEIKALGANAVAIHVPWATPDIRSSELAPRAGMTPSDPALRAAILSAHRAGLSVLLMPLVYVDEVAEGVWRGAIAPSSWRAWFEVYGRFVLQVAAIAEEEGVEILAVGSELCSSEAQRDEWLTLIGKVRMAYGGKLTYSANWDHRDGISFIGALDLVGTNAYFELSDAEAPTVDDLAAAWGPIVEKVEAWRQRTRKPLLLTEVGFPSRKGAASDPWDHASPREPDPGLQERLYRAFIRAWSGHPSLAGVYFYQWWGEGGPGDTGYTPRGKPAARALAEWFGRIEKGEAR